MRKHFPLDPILGVENAALLPWQDGVPTSGNEGSYPGHALVTDSEAELLNLLTAAGLPTSPTDLTQIAQAMSIGMLLGTFGGSANALTATLNGGVPIPQLLPGMVFHGYVGLNPNTAAGTLHISGFTADPGVQPIVRKDGASALQANDLPANCLVSFRWDGASFRFIGLTPSDITGTLLITTAITKNVYGANADFPTLAAALAWVSQFRITAMGSVTFQLPSGQILVSGQAASILATHPDGERITIQGTALTGPFPTYGSLALSGYSPAQRAADFAGNLAIARGVWATELHFTAGANMAVLGHLNLLNLLITNDGTAGVDGLALYSGRHSLNRICVAGAGNRGAVFSGSQAILANGLLSFGNNGPGISVENGSELSVLAGFAGDIIGMGNGATGVQALSGGHVGFLGGGSVYGSGNASFGVVSVANGKMDCGASPRAERNGADGFSAQISSALVCIGGAANANGGYAMSAYDTSFLNGNSVSGSGNIQAGFATLGSTIDATAATVTGSYSPALNTVGNANSYIRQ